MPIYEYVCKHCQHELEALQKLSDAPLVECPSCKQPELQKKISVAGFRLSGSGWYETDFKSGNKKNLAGSGESAAKSTDTSSKTSSGGSTDKPSTAAKAKDAG
ncbi:zinc ribbon domain-containing protein [Halioxenophilus sp. WMMB6]|uniref:FmdB family zinc ribbon protein n=1 Tax=Halioxenophilus sp. WMMB6 TaxID=3073815 RepID=UPI00295F00F1|nr:zinc ribbon domain-containing protein [Halioxenophilus sp. WMMB6]